MARDMSAFIADLRRDVDRWKEDMSRFEATGETQIVAAIRDWVTEAERIIKQSGPESDA